MTNCVCILKENNWSSSIMKTTSVILLGGGKAFWWIKLTSQEFYKHVSSLPSVNFCGKYQHSNLAYNHHHSLTPVIVWPILNFLKPSPQLNRECPEYPKVYLLSEFFHHTYLFHIVPEYFHLKPFSKIFVQNFQNLFLHSIQFAMQTFNLSTIIS